MDAATSIDAFEATDTTQLSRSACKRFAQKARNRTHEGVFAPGSASPPPLLVGRERQAERINALLNEIVNRTAVSTSIHALTLHGPRGAGKTVLLDLTKKALAAQKSAQIDCIPINGPALSSPQSLIQKTLAQIPTETSQTDSISAKIKIPHLMEWAIATAKTDPGTYQDQGLFQDAVLLYIEAHGRSPLFIVDEAHVADPATLGLMLSDIQTLNGSGLPCGAILAGTPDLVDVLDAANATWYLDRNTSARLVPVGAITDADAELAVKAPLDAMGIEYDDFDLTQAASWCSGNAHFTQALGKAALEAAFASAKDLHADFSEGGPVWSRFRKLANRRYEQAWRNLSRKGLTGCARQLGALWRWSQENEGATLYDEAIKAAITSGLKTPAIGETSDMRPKDAHRHFMRLGLLWSPTAQSEGPWELGLPSFFDHVEGIYANPQRPQYHKTLNDLVADESSFIPEVRSSDEDPSGP